MSRKLFDVQSGPNRLYGTVHLQEDGLSHPCLILGHGFTGNRNERLLVRIAESLEQKKIDCIRFDFNGHGESEGNPEDVTIASEIRDFELILDYAKSEKEVDNSNIFIAGHSVGGLDAIYLAAKRAADLRGLITISPAMTTYHELVQNLCGESLLEASEGISLDFGGFSVGRKIIDETALLTPFHSAQNINLPALLLHGEQDQDTPAFHSVILKKIWGDQAKLVLIPGADHCYRSAEAQNSVTEEITKYILEIVNDTAK